MAGGSSQRAEREPRVELDPRYSSTGARPVPWHEARRVLREAEIYWISSIHPAGRPHVTPLIAVWLDNALHFATGAEERKARNLARVPAVTMTTGSNVLSAGLDVVVEGEVERVIDHGTLQRLAGAYAAKYPEPFHFRPSDAGLDGEGGTALVFRVEPRTAFAYGRGATYSQTRYRFEEA